MDLSLPPHLERIIQEKIENGLYRTPHEVVEVALHLLAERDELQQQHLEALRGDIKEGIAALDRGDYHEYADWRELAEEIKAEGRRQSAHQVRAAG
jgi:antitoxin ParD1/3/4